VQGGSEHAAHLDGCSPHCAHGARAPRLVNRLDATPQAFGFSRARADRGAARRSVFRDKANAQNLSGAGRWAYRSRARKIAGALAKTGEPRDRRCRRDASAPRLAQRYDTLDVNAGPRALLALRPLTGAPTICASIAP